MTRPGYTMIAALAVVFAIGLAATAAPADSANISRLVKELGSDSWKLREEATRQLTEIGPAALPALREAMTSADLEVSLRAKQIAKDIQALTPQKLRELRQAVQVAFREANYKQVISLGQQLTLFDEADALDWMWLGHACQLDGQWKEAVHAYQTMVPLLAPSDNRKPSAPADEDGPVVVTPEDAKETSARAAVLSPASAGSASRQQLGVLLWIARMQSAELKDTKAAIATLEQAQRLTEDASKDIGATTDYFRVRVLRELATARHRAGDPRGALEIWAKLHAMQASKAGRTSVDVNEASQAISELPPGATVPDLPFLFLLSEQAPVVTLKPEDPKTQRRSFRPRDNADQPSWQYALCPPPGLEFATLEFACDIEQYKPRFGGHFNCFVQPDNLLPTSLGKRVGPASSQTGRDTYRMQTDVPGGTKVVYVETGSWKPNFDVHSVEINATFRKPTAKAPYSRAAWVQNEVLPKGGELTLNGKRTSPNSARDDYKAGRYQIRCQAPGRGETFETELNIDGGRHYGVFANVDSPFHWKQASGPGGIARDGQASVSRLGGVGTYLAIWGGEGSKIMLSRSGDLATWSTPEALALNSVFDNISPATMVDADGTLWLAYFSNRFCLQDTSTAAYRLLLASTRDGRTWSLPRVVSVDGTIEASPLPAVSMLRRQDGTCLMVWKAYAGSGKSFDQVHELAPIDLANGMHVWNQQVIEADGVLHLVFDDFGKGIYHCESKDAAAWSQPVKLVDGPQASHPQLLLADGQAMLIYSRVDGSFITAADLAAGKPVKSGDGIKITNHVIPLAGSRIARDADGKIMLLAGAETCWLLSATMEELTAAMAKAPPTAASPPAMPGP